jgi:molybdopterin-guanine dinucleotide biosynthesis protein A
VARRGLTGVLLVGGASRRFGSPKALARLGEETLAERAWRVLGEACDERIAVGKAGDALPLPFPVHDDGTQTRAPLAGVVAGLRDAAHDVVVVLPVDVPRATVGLIHALADACADAAVTRSGPLPAAFDRRVLGLLQRRLDAQQLALRDALGELDVRVVDVDPDLLANVNTPEELRRLSAELLTRRVATTPPPLGGG